MYKEKMHRQQELINEKGKIQEKYWRNKIDQKKKKNNLKAIK